MKYSNPGLLKNLPRLRMKLLNCETMMEGADSQDGKLFRIVTNKSEIEKGLFIKKGKREALFFQLELET
eukprot:scaffold361_cov265-Chaetoceros_neogracile.AAC.3